jgi:preprotein translocase subunit Sec61beta
VTADGDRPEVRAQVVEKGKRAGFWATVRAVLWSFLGIRRFNDYREDATSLDPKAVVVAGVLGGVLFVLAIVALVQLVVGLSE